MYYTLIDNTWVESEPTQTGQKFKHIDSAGVEIISFWDDDNIDINDSKITRLAFLNRFTDAEAIAIDMASIDNPSGTVQERQQQAVLRRFLNKVNSANYIDLSMQQTIDGVNALTALGLLTSERANVILTDTIERGERL